MGTIVPQGEVIDFEPVSEKWSTYIVNDKAPVVMKARVVVTKIIRTGQIDKVGQPMYAVGMSSPIVVSFAPAAIRGTPTIPPPSPQQLAISLTEDLKFEPKEEPWNEYKLKDETVLRLKLVITGVLKSPFFTADGDPFYSISHSVNTRIIISPELRKGLMKPDSPDIRTIS